MHTRSRLPVTLLFSEEHSDELAACQRERQIKRWTREKKLALAEARLATLKGISRRNRRSPSSSTLLRPPARAKRRAREPLPPRTVGQRPTAADSIQSLPMFRLDNKTALVTGAGSGIGEAIAHTLARQGAHVYIADRDAANGQRVAEAIGGDKGQAEFVELDVTDEAALARLAEHGSTPRTAGSTSSSTTPGSAMSAPW